MSNEQQIEETITLRPHVSSSLFFYICFMSLYHVLVRFFGFFLSCDIITLQTSRWLA